ncbi:MAG: DUF108 domain-containing protein [Mailhella sp.]|nr:DUF108 domain-containing protein [Mailhella sp.]
MERKRIAVIGCGALGSLVAEGIVQDLQEKWELAGVYARTASKAQALASRTGCAAFGSVQELLAAAPDVVVEAAGGDAAREYAEAVLRSGSSLVLLSGGVLADGAFARRLKEAAEQGGSILHIASGAIGGFDIMRTLAFRERQLARRGQEPLPGQELSARVDNFKAPGSLNGAPFLQGKYLPEDRRTEVFSGTAAEAIAGFPKNVNVAVAAASASAGMERTAVTITSDPALTENTHCIHVQGFGVRAEMEFASLPDPENPRSSTMTAWSVLALLDEMTSPVRYF